MNTADAFNPFAVTPGQANSPYDDESVMGGGARAIVHDLQRGDLAIARYGLLLATEHALARRMSDLRYAKSATEQIRDNFLENEGADLFERDPATNKVLKNPDGSYVPKFGAEIDSLRTRSKETVGFLRGALTGAIRGDLAPAAIAAAKELAEREPIYKAKLDKWARIQAQLKAISDVHDATELELGGVANDRLSREGILFFSDSRPK